jgi:aldose 1-epimerase
MKMKQENFNKTVDGKTVGLYTIKGGRIEVSVTNYGAKIVSLMAPDKNGKTDDVVLGFDTIDDYLDKEPFFGAVCGRFANRIRKGHFVLEGQTYDLVVNNGANHLHGGIKGFNAVVWDVEQVSDNRLVLFYLSKDGEEGYPGNLKTTVTYQITNDDELIVHYQAFSDRVTVLNLCQHSFFNLKGAGNGHIEDHYLTVDADYYTPLDETQAPVGTVLKVDGSLMDFRSPVLIADRINADFDQFVFGRGIDNNWVINKAQAGELAHAATLSEPVSGRRLDVYTTQPGIQVYSGNWIENHVGKYGKQYDVRYAICLEAQGFPCSPNYPHFPSPVLKPGETYDETCIYKFGID